MTQSGQKKARLETLTSWYDADRPEKLCTDVENFLAAHFLWAEHYIKPDPWNTGFYHFEDPVCKYEMVRMAMSEPTVPTEPSKSVVHAPRRLGKTQTLIQEMVPLMVITRPHTEVLVAEANATRTEEEIKKIKLQIENNQQIKADFGGAGVLYPKSSKSGQSWRDNRLDFLHLPRCAILGHSISSAQRGRGPIFGIIDDPEGDDDSFSKKWRKEYFHKLFSTFVPMFHHGGKILWIGTVIHRQSCLAMALDGLAQVDDEMEARDTRFDDWHKRRFKYMDTDENGVDYVQQPERLSLEGFEKKKETMGLAAVMAELQGTPISHGDAAFNFTPMKHGYMRCTNEAGLEYHLDLKTGEETDWDKWVDDLLVCGAADLADGTGPDADPGAAVFAGADNGGTVHVLDAWEKRAHATDLIQKSYVMAERWGAIRMGWEKVAMQTVVVRLAREYADKLRQEGKVPPLPIDIENNTKSKINRVLTMIPLFEQGRIKFPVVMGTFVDKKGKQHTASVLPNKRSHDELQLQVEDFTDEGTTGHDDLIDALEMCIRVIGTQTPRDAPKSNDPNDIVMEQWQEAGLEMSKERIPMTTWTDKMWQEHNEDASLEDEDGEFWEDCE